MKIQVSPATPRSDHAAAILRSHIIDGVLESGAFLVEAAAARDLDISRIPVREALVEFSATGRAYVKNLSPHDFEELYVLRLALEPVAARLATAALRNDASRLEANIQATIKASTLLQVTRLDLDFHEIILEASGNARLLKLWHALRSELELWLGRLHRSKQLQTRGTCVETVTSHKGLVTAFKTKSPAECERLMRQHILSWREWLPTTEVKA